MHKDRRQPIHELRDTVGISYGVCQEILTKYLNMHRIAVKFVPQLLTNDQGQRHVNVCLELQEKANKDPTFISSIIMGDDSWVYSYGYDPETKQRSFQCKSSQKVCYEKEWNFGATTTGSFVTTVRLPTCPRKPQSL
jgi:hypothetical protein